MRSGRAIDVIPTEWMLTVSSFLPLALQAGRLQNKLQALVYDIHKPVLNWANVCSPEHTSDTSINYDSFLN